jgi:methyl-accepting chemotaxis protein
MNLSVSKKLYLQIILVMVLFCLLLIGLYFPISEAIFEQKYDRQKSLIEVAHGVVNSFVKKESDGTLSRAEAQASAKEALRSMRYEGTNYYWVNDYGARIVMHAVKPSLEGQDLSDYQDKAGTKIFSMFAEKARGSSEPAFVDYWFPMPGKSQDEVYRKVGYVQSVPAWQWVIGSAAYAEDIEEQLFEIKEIAAGVFAVIAIILGVVSYYISRSIIVPLGNVVETLKDISEGEGDLTKRLDVQGEDELGQLASYFNLFLDKLETMISSFGRSTQSMVGYA